MEKENVLEFILLVSAFGFLLNSDTWKPKRVQGYVRMYVPWFCPPQGPGIVSCSDNRHT